MTTDRTLRDHAREAVRDEVSKQAWTLFARQGFEATTVDQIAEAAGMSRRTFFRYFAGKDELVLDRIVASGRLVADALRDRPADEAAWRALRAAFGETVALQEQHPETSRRVQIMLRDEPALRTTVEARRRLWLELLAPLTAQRMPGRATDDSVVIGAAAVTSSAIACLEVAQIAWATRPGSDLGGLLDEAMGAVAPLG